MKNLFFPSQILSLYDNVNAIDVDKVVEYVRQLQQEDGSFAGDKWGVQGSVIFGHISL